MIRAGIYGATGYTGWELVKILQRHPAVEIAFVATRSQAGKTLRDLFPAAPRPPSPGHGSGVMGCLSRERADTQTPTARPLWPGGFLIRRLGRLKKRTSRQDR